MTDNPTLHLADVRMEMARDVLETTRSLPPPGRLTLTYEWYGEMPRAVAEFVTAASAPLHSYQVPKPPTKVGI